VRPWSRSSTVILRQLAHYRLNHAKRNCVNVGIPAEFVLDVPRCLIAKPLLATLAMRVTLLRGAAMHVLNHAAVVEVT
jgi:hypothetical protein